MSVLRQQNWLGQQRVDIPHIRAIESSICADFDVLAGRIMAGDTPMVVTGFDAVTVGMTGQPASTMQLVVANAVVMHPRATEAGTIFFVPADRPVEVLNSVTNPRVEGGFTANTVNYVGIDLVRSADATTSDLVQFLNPRTNAETPKDVPLGRTLDYVITVTTQDFSTTPGICPIAIVTTDSSNNVVSNGIVDARELFYRLGSGGSVPNVNYTYPWPAGRTENDNGTDYGVADKAITNMKDWADAVMTRLWEIGGGLHWYTPTNIINITMTRSGSTFTNGQNFEWDGTNLHWKGLNILFDNTPGWQNTVIDVTVDTPGLTDLAAGDCIYVDLDRTMNANLNAAKAPLATLGSPLIPGSRIVIAWRFGASIFTRGSDYAVGTTFAVATTTSVGLVQLQRTPGNPAAPVVFNPDSSGKLLVQATSTAIQAVRTDLSTNNGMMLVQDGNNQNRFLIDRNGYMMGRNGRFYEDWTGVALTGINNNITQSPMTGTIQWKAQTAAVASSIIDFGRSDTGEYNGASVNLSVGNANQVTHLETGNLFNVTSTGFTPLVATFQGDMSFNTGHASWGFGTGDLVSDNDYVRFRYDGTQYHIETCNSGTQTSVATGIAANAFSRPDRLRIEWFGSTSAQGVAAGNIPIVWFYINDLTYSASINTNIPNGADFSFHMKFIISVDSNNASCSFGPIEGAWNIWNNPPGL